MICSTCRRRVDECECQKNNELTKRWPKGTWFQERLKKVMIAQVNGKQDTRDAGYSVLEVMLFLAIFAAIMVSLITFSYVGKQAIENLQSVERCIKALLECTTI